MKLSGLEWAIAGCFWLSIGNFSSTTRAASGASVSSTAARLSQAEWAQAAEFDYDDFDFWAEQCLLSQAAEDYETALASCDRAISLQPDAENIDLWTARGTAQFHLGLYVEALASHQYVTALRPESSPALTHQCVTLVYLDQFEAAINTCQHAIELDNDWGDSSPLAAWYHKGVALLELGLRQRAFNAFSRAQVFAPSDPRLEAELCILKEALDHGSGCPLVKAASAYDQALVDDPQNFRLWYRQGLVLEQLGRYHQALTSYEQAIALRPDSTLALAHQCAVLNELDNFEGAIAACEAALQGDARWDTLGPAYGWSQISVAQVGLGEYEAALAAADRAIALNEDYLSGWNNRAVSLWYLGQPEDALRAIDAQGETRLVEPFVFERRRQVLMAFNRGRILYDLGLYQQAASAYSQAIALQQLGQDYLGDSGLLVSNHFLADLWINLATTQLADGRFVDAILAATTATQQYPNETDAWYTLALAHLANNDEVSAWEAYQQAARLQPNRPDVLMGQGITLKRAGCPQAAFQVFGVLLNLDPNNLQARQEYLQLLEAQQQAIVLPNDETDTTFVCPLVPSS
ncbi:tetratricopeptide repeat protein [Oscillatoria sp. CS-180]|uniref:tetratricopeptide repeat protein n=1 Tax=Oscillatoria sp. CS-180 TaxID=3021720 RepID=UPI00232BF33B|nr:tetratricopeptide repeat protein [Oscillatoria sp. CS-180]MDB9526530.1 tetratricopeptide repeat protein [Oscillatoria sp. CS-180]